MFGQVLLLKIESAVSALKDLQQGGSSNSTDIPKGNHKIRKKASFLLSESYVRALIKSDLKLISRSRNSSLKSSSESKSDIAASTVAPSFHSAMQIANERDGYMLPKTAHSRKFKQTRRSIAMGSTAMRRTRLSPHYIPNFMMSGQGKVLDFPNEVSL